MVRGVWVWENIFYSECDDDKNCTFGEDNDSNWEESSSEELSSAYRCPIVFFLFFPLFSNLLLLVSGYEKRLPQSIYDAKK